MRQIKFRAWDKVSKVMVYNPMLDYDMKIGWRTADGKHSDLMQLTGLHDKNGEEIWDGDIIRVENGIQPFEVKWAVQEWDEDGFHTGFHLTFTSDQYEVLGNIYENPSLLTQGEVG